MTQISLFGPAQAVARKPVGDQWKMLRVLITVKAAPNPSSEYGETVCVAGLSMDPSRPGWIRLYPVNFRDLESSQQFHKYEIVSVRAKPARRDPRIESWRPDLTSIAKEQWLPPWKPRQPHIEPYVMDSMCAIRRAVLEHPPARSLAAVRPYHIDGLDIEPHPGWTNEEQAKIDSYVTQLSLSTANRTALEAPRFRGWYRYRCGDSVCTGHRQGILDWEFVALQRKLADLDDATTIDRLRAAFLDKLCAADRDTVFFVGNQAKRLSVFSVIGVYYPPRH